MWVIIQWQQHTVLSRQKPWCLGDDDDVTTNNKKLAEKLSALRFMEVKNTITNTDSFKTTAISDTYYLKLLAEYGIKKVQF